jgi:hypothetical protein
MSSSVNNKISWADMVSDDSNHDSFQGQGILPSRKISEQAQESKENMMNGGASEKKGEKRTVTFEFNRPSAAGAGATSSSASHKKGPSKPETKHVRGKKSATAVQQEESSYQSPPLSELENSRSGLNAELAGFGVYLPSKGGVVIEDSNTHSILMKRGSPDTPAAKEDKIDEGEEDGGEKKSKRPKHQFPVDPVFGGHMATRTVVKNTHKK